MGTLKLFDRGHSIERGVRPGDPQCDHDKPMVIEKTDVGQRYARCLCCQAIGPQRPNPQAARQALQEWGAS
jgi:hypothetical protein